MAFSSIKIFKLFGWVNQSYSQLRKILMLLALFLSMQEAALAGPCKNKILVVPPPIRDPAFNGWLIGQAQSSYIRFRKFACDPFLSIESTASHFDYLGQLVRKPSTIRPRQLEFVKERTNADQLIFLELDSRKKPILKMRVYDLLDIEGHLSLRQIDDLEVLLDPKATKQKRSSIIGSAFRFLLPNAFSLGVSDVRADMDLVPGYKEISNVNKSSIPAFLSSIQISQINHPDSFGLFDITFTLYPGMFLFALDQYTTIRNKLDTEAGEDRVLHLQALGANFNLNGEITVHSALGASYFSLGIGPSYFIAKQDDDEQQTVFSDYDFRVKVGQRAFILKNLFMSLELDQMVLRRYLYYSENLAKTQYITRLSASIGWYFPVSSFF